MDSRGQSVRLLEMAQTFLTDAEVDELVTVYEGRLLAAFEGVLRAGMVIANVSLITFSEAAHLASCIRVGEDSDRSSRE